MSQLPLSGLSNLFVLQQHIAEEGSRDAWFRSACLDGNAMSETQREAKAEAAENCSWRGDSPEPELDDLAHSTSNHRVHRPNEVCIWRGDSPEPELDDLAHHHESPSVSPRSREISHVDPQPIDIEQLDTPKKRKKSKKPDEHKDPPKEPPKELKREIPLGWFYTYNGGTLGADDSQRKPPRRQIIGIRHMIPVGRRYTHTIIWG